MQKDIAPSRKQTVRATPGRESAVNEENWYVPAAEDAQRILAHGDVDSARCAFEKILARLDDKPSYARAMIMERVGRCHLMEGSPSAAIEKFQRAIKTTENIEASSGVRRLQGVLQSGLGDAFRAAGNLEQARVSYEEALKIAESTDDARARAVDLDHLGSLAYQQGRSKKAISFFERALQIFVKLGERPPQAIARLHLGMACQQCARWKDAERQYVEAVRILEECGDFPGVAGCSTHVANVLEKSGRHEEAEEWHRKALDAARVSKNSFDIRGRLLSLARFLKGRATDRSEIRQLAQEALARSGTSLDADVWETYGLLAEVIEGEAQATPDQAARAAMNVQAHDYRNIHKFGPRLMNTLASLGPGPGFGHAVILERLARCCLAGARPGPATILYQDAIETIRQIPSDDVVLGLTSVVHAGLGDALQNLGRGPEALDAFRKAAKISEELGNLGGEAILRQHLGTMALANGEMLDAVTHFSRVAANYEALGERGQKAVALHDLAKAYELGGQWSQARQHYLQAIQIWETLGDRPSAAQVRLELDSLMQSHRLPPTDAIIASAHGDAAIAGLADLAVFVRDEASTDCIFNTDLLVDVQREVRAYQWLGEAEELSGDLVPTLVLGARTCVEEGGGIRVYLPESEPKFDPQQDCVVMRRYVRELSILADPQLAWKVIRNLDGVSTVEKIAASFSINERPVAQRLLAALVSNNAIDMSGRPIGRYLHSSTKKGVVAAPGLGSDDVLRLVADGNYRSYPDAAQIALGSHTPKSLEPLYSLTRGRRSRRDYNGKSIARQELDALLHTACGVTGDMLWNDRKINLRAYPSSGGLYAVEIYPVTIRVKGLEPGVYHYVANDNALDVVRTPIDIDRFISAILPIERSMVSGVAAMVCLVGRFQRHERKYGQGGYRMMAAEAGHISQNLVLAAVAMGLAARPFGGVFDSMINAQLGLDDAEEQFLLSTLVGHAGT